MDSDFDKKTMDEINQRHLPVAYFQFKKKQITSEKIKKVMTSLGGLPFLWGQIKHPKYSHALFFSAKKGDASDLDDLLCNFVNEVHPKEWESALGVKHEFPQASKKEVFEQLKDDFDEMAKIKKDWDEHWDTMGDDEKIAVAQRFEYYGPQKNK